MRWTETGQDPHSLKRFMAGTITVIPSSLPSNNTTDNVKFPSFLLLARWVAVSKKVRYGLKELMHTPDLTAIRKIWLDRQIRRCTQSQNALAGGGHRRRQAGGAAVTAGCA